MTANKILLQMKYARVVKIFAAQAKISLAKALSFFYRSQTYRLVSQGIGDMHCMSDRYLAEDLNNEFLREREL